MTRTDFEIVPVQVQRIAYLDGSELTMLESNLGRRTRELELSDRWHGDRGKWRRWGRNDSGGNCGESSGRNPRRTVDRQGDECAEITSDGEAERMSCSPRRSCRSPSTFIDNEPSESPANLPMRKRMSTDDRTA